jgi:hypothetical protein
MAFLTVAAITQVQIRRRREKLFLQWLSYFTLSEIKRYWTSRKPQSAGKKGYVSFGAPVCIEPESSKL